MSLVITFLCLLLTEGNLTIAAKDRFIQQGTNGSIICTSYQFNVTASSYVVSFREVQRTRCLTYTALNVTDRSCNNYASKKGYKSMCKKGKKDSEWKVYELIIENVGWEDYKRKWVCCVSYCKDYQMSNVIEIKQHGNYCSYIVLTICASVCV